ncbi:GtrA family protein [Streptomyces sp. LX-29]|uniref:GtrA family protein n=1 Tax=Streptomyces sp. LX-29 TaxID=2900152 RepID=UPI00240D3488|nr:GtrA family protein [Streptomyces sp. LX-29]WFB11731.1 GtrA family protein [Streptomyces sp. LX-29]
MARARALLPELVGFAAAGAAAYVVDVVLFVWLRGPGGLGPLPAKALSFVAACSVAYAGNAAGTYRRRAPAGAHATRRAARFAVFCGINAAGAAVQLLCLVVSHYGLGLTSARADAVSGAGVGMALATCLRFWGTRTLVFRVRPGPGEVGRRDT